METGLNGGMPPQFVDLKQEIASSYPDFEQQATKAWNEILAALEEITKNIVEEGSESIAQVDFSQLASLTLPEIERIKRKGCVVIRDVVDDAEARGWKDALEEFIKSNPDVEGVPANNKQFFQLFWTKSQVLARSHPNMLAAQVWANNLYHIKSGRAPEGVDLSTPLSYADRFRIRRPGIRWDVHPPHVDGGAIERWQDEQFRTCFADILSGNWRAHDPYDLEGRLNARSSLYGRPNQSTVFRTFQGWLALSETAPTQGTLKVFPDVLISNAYLILRPFFRPRVTGDPKTLLDPQNWAFGRYFRLLPSPQCPLSDLVRYLYTGISWYLPQGWWIRWASPYPCTPSTSQARANDDFRTSSEARRYGLLALRCHSFRGRRAHRQGRFCRYAMHSSTPQNEAYVKRQFDDFVKGKRPADFPKGQDEIGFVGVGRPEDVVNPLGRRAMGAPVEVM